MGDKTKGEGEKKKKRWQVKLRSNPVF